MDDEEQLGFDLNSLCLDDIQLDASDLAELGILADDPTVDDLKALEAMADASPRSPRVQGNFGMIRALPAEDRAADYNIDNVQLTTADMQDPDLLRELGMILSDEPAVKTPPAQEASVPSVVRVDDSDMPLELMLESDNKDELERWLLQEKAKAVALKQAGDQEGARTALRSFKALQARLTDLTTVPDELREAMPVEDVEGLKKQVLEAKRGGDLDLARELMTRLVALQGGTPSSPPPPSSSAKTKQLMQLLVKQAEECLDAAKVHLKTGSKTDASMFMNRKKAFETDLAALKAAHQAKRPAPNGRSVTVSLPVDLENIDVAEDELKVLITSLAESERPGRRSKESLSPTNSLAGEYYFKVALGWPAEQPEELTLPVFKMPCPPLDIRCTFPGIQRSVKALKFFEHHKLRLDLYRRESSFLRTKHVLVGSAHLRLAPLLLQPTIEAAGIELVDGSRRSVGLQVEVAVRLRRPISSKALAVKTMQWTVFDEFSSGRLFPIPGQSPPAQSPVASPTVLDTPPVSPTDTSIQEEVDAIQSYAVVEHEIEQLAKNPASTTDPVLSLRLLALESRRDAMDLRFQLGQISFEDYLASLHSSIDSTKHKALEAKRAGDLPQARNYMMHVQIIEKEIAQASAEGEEDE